MTTAPRTARIQEEKEPTRNSSAFCPASSLLISGNRITPLAATIAATAAGLASNSKNVGDDSISGRGQKNGNSDGGSHLGSSGTKRLGHKGADRYNEKQESRTSKSRKRQHVTQVLPGTLAPQPALLTKSRQPRPPSLRNQTPAHPSH